MTISDRTLEPHEQARLVAVFQPHRQGCASQVVLLGLFMVFVPAVAGGILRLLLVHAGVPEQAASWAAFGAGAGAGVWMWLRSRAEDARQRGILAAKRNTITSRVVARRFAFNAARAWEVADFDHGPAFLVSETGGAFIYIHSMSPDIEALGRPRESMSITVAHPLGVVLSASAGGAEIPLATQELEEVDVSDPDTGMPLEFAYYTTATLPQPWLAATAA